MTKTQTQIIEMIAKLPLRERKELVDHIHDARLLEESVYDQLTPEQRANLDESIAQADRGEVEPAAVVFDRLARRFGIPTT